MATRLYRSRALATALQLPNPPLPSRSGQAARCISTTSSRHVALPKDVSNPKPAKRQPQGSLKAPIVNPSDKYSSKADDLHRYGTWVMGCLPKYVQQFSVWKDELTIYI